MSRALASLLVALALAAAPGAPAAAPPPTERVERPAAGPRAVVSIRPAATVRQTEVRLGEIADIAAADPALAARLAALEVGRAPLPGLSRAIDLPYIKARLRWQQVDLAAVALDGPPAVTVTAASQTLPGEALVEAVRAQLLAEQGEEADRLSVRAAGSVPDLLLPLGAVSLKVQRRAGAPRLGSLGATVEVWVDGEPARTVRVAVRLSRRTDVVVAARPIPRHAVIGPDDVRLERREVTAPGEAPAGLEGVVGRRALRGVAAGEAVQPAMLELAPLVRRGDLVVLVAEGRGVRAMSPGEAREEGRAGQVIRVKNLASGRDVHGQVEAEGRVRVHF
ncbi:MAG: flagellar basal body P-ring formation chaperone FlgA [Candidatus Methylomirabilales bacterium]